MDKDFMKMDKAFKTTEKLAHSIQAMEQLKKISINTQPPPAVVHKQYATSP